MALQKAGDVSEPVRTSAGLHILRYNSDVPAGPVALETVREALSAEALESLKYDAYDAQLAKWVEEAGITYHREALQ
jgi:parvulin-like peptidyl-prolyl isomerase